MGERGRRGRDAPRIWIDLANSPHVLFFAPLVSRLRARGIEPLFTSRDFAQTIPLARTYGLEGRVVGGHTGSRFAAKLARIVGRAVALARAMRSQRVDLAVGHNSYSQVLAARLLRVPAVTLMDYEFQPANHLSFRLARRVIVPFTFPEEDLRRCGASAARTFRYQGLKEEVYLADFEPDPQFEDQLRGALLPAPRSDEDLRAGPLAVLRPPATFALYHGPENRLFDAAIEHLSSFAAANVIVCPRTSEQRERLRARAGPNVRILETPVRGLDLLARADLAMSAGGTMNREAALLGTPTYTVLAARLGSADRWLIDQGRMVQIATDEDLARVVPGKVDARARAPSNHALPDSVLELILGALP
jgi:predicted glycosyltransferase